MFDFLGGAGSLIGLLGSLSGQGGARGDYNDAKKGIEEITGWRRELRNQIKAWMDQQRNAGFYDYRQRMAMLNGAIDRTNNQALTNSAVYGRIAGYAPGDTPMKDAIATAQVSNQNRMADMTYKTYLDAHDAEASDLGLYDQASRAPEVINAYQGLMGSASQRMAQGSAGIGAALTGLGDAFKKPPAEPKANQPQARQNSSGFSLGTGGYMNYLPPQATRSGRANPRWSRNKAIEGGVSF